jgi:hypothetical protein
MTYQVFHSLKEFGYYHLEFHEYTYIKGCNYKVQLSGLYAE